MAKKKTKRPKIRRTKPKIKYRPKKKAKRFLKKRSALTRKIHKKLKHEPMARLLLPLYKVKEIFRTRYGFFLYDGSEFVINNPETPSPWSNILTNGDYGMIISQSGCGLSFKSGIANRITNWNQDFSASTFGKFVYIRDNQTQDFWSATWKPVCKQPQFYEARHGVGYTNITSSNNGIMSSLIYYVAADENIEVWQMRIRNITEQERFLSIFTYLEWDFGIPSGNREYNKLFVDTSYNEQLSAIFAKMPSSEWAFHSVNHKVSTFTCGREFFVGAYRDLSKPRGVEKGMCFGEHGRYNDPAACLHIEIELPPHGEKELIFCVGVCSEQKAAEALIKKYKNIKVVEEEFSRACHRWTMRFNNFHVTTPDEGANVLTNRWFRYQAVSSGMAALGSCYNPYGKVSFKDLLINGLVFLSMNPKHYRQVLLDCAEKEFADGSIIEEWEPKTLKGKKSASIEEPLWLIYSLCEYLKETKDISVLDEEVRYQDAPKESLFKHCVKIIDSSLSSIGKRGLPPILNGDYMKRLDGCFKDTKGESVWLGQFLAYIISEFLAVCALKKESKAISDYEARLKKLKDRIKKTTFSEDRFIRAITHSGRELGISKGKNASLFLDTQAWAVILGLCEKEEEAKALMQNVEKQLLKDSGPIVMTPSFEEYDEQVGTLSRLPKGVMENGGISVEAACWTIWALTKLGRANVAWEIYTKLNPVDRSHKSDQYRLEPFVAAEYIDGPDSPTNGLARNSWYNRSGYWMFKVITEEILGIKPTYEGLKISPCIPNRWRLFKLRRAFRNAQYTIEVINPRYVSQGIAEVIVDGKTIKSNIIPEFGDEKRHYVKVIMGKSR